MITVSMGKDKGVKVPKIDTHLLSISEEEPRQSGIEEDLLSSSFQEEREPGFATVIVIPDGGIIHKDGEGKPGCHTHVSPLQGDETYPDEKKAVSE
jgi:hypothetical protein